MESDSDEVLVVRDVSLTDRCRVVTARVAKRFGTGVAVLFEESILSRYSFIERRLDHRWTRISNADHVPDEHGDAYVEYRADLSEASETIDGLLEIASTKDFWAFSEMTLFVDDSWYFHLPGDADHTHAAFLRTEVADASFSNAISEALDDLPACVLSTGTREQWDDGDRWFEIRESFLTVYDDDVSDLSEEEKEYYTTHADYSLARIEGILADEGSRTIRLEWTDDTSSGAVLGVLGGLIESIRPDPPEVLRFEDLETFERVAEELTGTVEQFWPSAAVDGR